MIIREYLCNLFKTDLLEINLIYLDSRYDIEIEIDYMDGDAIYIFISHKDVVGSFVFDLSWDVTEFFKKIIWTSAFPILERNYKIDQFLK